MQHSIKVSSLMRDLGFDPREGSVRIPSGFFFAPQIQLLTLEAKIIFLGLHCVAREKGHKFQKIKISSEKIKEFTGLDDETILKSLHQLQKFQLINLSSSTVPMSQNPKEPVTITNNPVVFNHLSPSYLSPSYQVNPEERKGDSQGGAIGVAQRSEPLSSKIVHDVKIPRKLTPEDLVGWWNRNCQELPKCRVLTEARRKKTKKQLDLYPELDHWEQVLAKWHDSTFCLFYWKPGFDDLLSEEKRIRTLEDKYSNRDGLSTGGWD